MSWSVWTKPVLTADCSKEPQVCLHPHHGSAVNEDLGRMWRGDTVGGQCILCRDITNTIV